jgi:outer membrane lipoprotein-sorting protein
MRSASLLLTGLLALLFARSAAAGGQESEVPDCVRATVEAIQKRYEAVDDLRASFEQTTRSVALGASGPLTTSRGRVVFAKPGKMRWSYSEPEESLVVSDGRWLWLYDPLQREAQKLAVGDGYLSGAAIQFLMGEGEILRNFRVTAESCDESQARLALVPRRPASYERLRVRADRVSGDLLETEIVDLLGNVTRVAFEGIETNVDPAPELFRFVPPAGVAVIELDAPPRGP